MTRKPIPQRCEQCGSWANPRLPQSRTFKCRTAHPEAALIDWAIAAGAKKGSPRIALAYEAVCRLSREGANIERWIEDFTGVGCTKAQLALALVYARRWALPEFNASPAPSPRSTVSPFAIAKALAYVSVPAVSFIQRPGTFHERGCTRGLRELGPCVCWQRWVCPNCGAELSLRLSICGLCAESRPALKAV